ncbi:hypothetical protein DL98DRAFT_520307 [Cadophora sp. DSE1049]|nr:hypothetical protein DL98DRAFT_520307 [Cadophora sp. DSE1049]
MPRVETRRHKPCRDAPEQKREREQEQEQEQERGQEGRKQGEQKQQSTEKAGTPRSTAESSHLLRPAQKALSTSRLKPRQKSRPRLRRDFLVELCRSHLMISKMSSKMTAEDISLLKVDITLVEGSETTSLNSALSGYSLETSNTNLSPETVQETSSLPVLDNPFNDLSIEDSNCDLSKPTLDHIYNVLSYVSYSIMSHIGKDYSTASNTDESYPSWALHGVTHPLEDDTQHFVVTTCHTAETVPADGILQSELLSCVVTAKLIQHKKDHNKDSPVEGPSHLCYPRFPSNPRLPLRSHLALPHGRKGFLAHISGGV